MQQQTIIWSAGVVFGAVTASARTHYPLQLVVYAANVPARTRAPEGMRWVPIATFCDEALPNVMRKAIAHGLGE